MISVLCFHTTAAVLPTWSFLVEDCKHSGCGSPQRVLGRRDHYPSLQSSCTHGAPAPHPRGWGGGGGGTGVSLAGPGARLGTDLANLTEARLWRGSTERDIRVMQAVMEMVVIDMNRGPNLSPRVQGPGTPNITSACAHAPHRRTTRHVRQPNNYYLRLCARYNYECAFTHQCAKVQLSLY